jgi:acyl-CoA reductase-like NAD-dependent aldehyde dehydrogenase
MKTHVKKAVNLAFLLMLITLTTQSFGQRGRKMNNCCQNIPNLTEEQQDQIDELRSSHLEKMAELRQERRGTTNFDEKDEIREKMLKERETHREEIRALLTEEQQAYFDKHYRNMRNYNARNSNCGNNKAGKGRGQRNR